MSPTRLAPLAAAALLAAGLVPGAAHADRRTLVRAYEYATQPRGNLDLELWNDVASPRVGGLGAATVTPRLELEYGLTDHWDLALYHVFQQGPGEAFHLDAWRLETRYRFAERGLWPVDVMVYLEVERPADLAAPFEVEERLVLQRDLGGLALVANVSAEQHLLRGDLGHRYEVDLGARYEVVPALRVGLEGWSRTEVVGSRVTTGFYLGPGISVATDKFWFQVGAGAGLGQSPDALFVRSVLGITL